MNIAVPPRGFKATSHALPPSARREAWLGWTAYACAVHGQLFALAVVRPGPLVLGLQVVLLAATLASALLSVVHDAGHSEFARRAWVNVAAAQIAVPIGLWVGQYRVKHRIPHSQANVYGVDESTTPHPLLRIHPETPYRAWHRYQHLYAPALYAVAWVGDLGSQVRFLRTGRVGTGRVGTFRTRSASYAAEKAVTIALLLPYALLAGPGRFLAIWFGVLAVASLLAALVLIAGHVNLGLIDVPDASFVTRAFTTTAAFSTHSLWMRRLTGGLTHHHVHHLRPHAPRSTFGAMHVDLVVPMAAEQRLPMVEFPTLGAAVAGHFRRLRELGAQAARCDQFAATKSAIAVATSSPLSSCRKWPACSIVRCGWSAVPGTRSRKSRSLPAVTGSLSLNSISIGFSHFAKTSHAARFASDAGSSGEIGTRTGNCRAPAL